MKIAAIWCGRWKWHNGHDCVSLWMPCIRGGFRLFESKLKHSTLARKKVQQNRISKYTWIASGAAVHNHFVLILAVFLPRYIKRRYMPDVGSIAKISHRFLSAKVGQKSTHVQRIPGVPQYSVSFIFVDTISSFASIRRYSWAFSHDYLMAYLRIAETSK